jgi:hypothetical protein
MKWSARRSPGPCLSAESGRRQRAHQRAPPRIRHHRGARGRRSRVRTSSTRYISGASAITPMTEHAHAASGSKQHDIHPSSPASTGEPDQHGRGCAPRSACAGRSGGLRRPLSPPLAGIYGYCYRELGSAERAEDAAQQVFAQALASLPRCRETGRFSAWLYTLAQWSLRHSGERRRGLTAIGTRPSPGAS